MGQFFSSSLWSCSEGDGYWRGRKEAEKSCVGRRTFSSVLIYMGRHRLPVDDINHDALPIRGTTLRVCELIFR